MKTKITVKKWFCSFHATLLKSAEMEGEQDPFLQTHTKSVLEISLDSKVGALTSKNTVFKQNQEGYFALSEFFSLVPKIQLSLYPIKSWTHVPPGFKSTREVIHNTSENNLSKGMQQQGPGFWGLWTPQVTTVLVLCWMSLFVQRENALGRNKGTSIHPFCIS